MPILVGDAVYALYGIAIRLPRAGDNLQSAKAALADGDVRAAGSFLSDAAEDAEAARDLTRHPAFWILRAVPDGRYVASMTEAAELATDAGREGLSAAEDLGGNPQDIAASVLSGGRVNLDAIEDAQGPISASAALLRRATTTLQGADEPWFDRVSEAGAPAEERISEAASSLGTADQVLGVLPQMLGADGPRRYLLGFQALGEARATGGLIGFTGTLDVREGVLELTDTKPILRSLPSEFEEPVDAPDWFETSYGPQSALTQPQQVNTSPNFPTVAKVMLEMFESQTNKEFDGMILMDPVALEHLLPATDPITVPGWPDPITAENVVDVMLRDSYLELDAESQNRFLARVVQIFWDRISDGDLDAAAFATGLGDAISTQHFRVHATDAASAKAMAGADADGDYTRSNPNVQIAFHNNYSANKVDYFLRRDIQTTVTLERGFALVDARITMTNNAPDGPPSLLLGPSQTFTPDDPPGMNRMLFNVLLPMGAEDVVFGTGRRAADPLIYEDEGHFVAWQVLEIPAGEQVTVHLSYRLTDPFEQREDGIAFSFTHYPQPSVIPDTFSLDVKAPEGYRLLPAHQDSRSGSSPEPKQSLEGTLDEPATLDLLLIEQAR